ncbi:MAG: hypothetical protein J7L42_00380 [Elusimicrobia bacterium]|nr:hypothetical protein [Elusimicrobiota bacterium]
MNKVFVALTGDVVASRKISYRSRFQQKLLKVIEKINKEFKKVLVVKFAITVGDEFQGLLNSLETSYEIVKEFHQNLFPVKLTFGVGAGRISTAIRKRTSEMDGECFVFSRKALEQAKKLKQSVVYITGKKDRDIAVNTIISLIDTIKSNWKEIHYRRVFRYQCLGTLEEVAKKEKVSKQVISKMFSQIKYAEVKEAEKNLKELLSTL